MAFTKDFMSSFSLGNIAAVMVIAFVAQAVVQRDIFGIGKIVTPTA